MSPWQKHNLAEINKRLVGARQARTGVLFDQQSQYNHVVVRKTVGQLLLCYRYPRNFIEEIESRLSVADPLALLSEYTQAMLLALAWRPTPRRILLIGLGGGRLQLVLHHYLEQAVLDTAELDPLVLEVAQRFFGFAPDERQRVILQDGRKYLRSLSGEGRYDVIFLDAYRVTGVPPHLSTREFYDECRNALAPAGVVATNLHSGTSQYHAARKTFASAFRHSVAFSLLGGNIVVVGSDVEQLTQDEIRTRIGLVQERYGFDFALPSLVETMSTVTPSSPSAPILRDAMITK